MIGKLIKFHGTRRWGQDKIFMGEALLLKRTSCSVGNVAAKFLSIIFKAEELINHNCTGTQGKGQLNTAKMRIIKKYALKLYPAQEHLVWRKCVPSTNFCDGKSGNDRTKSSQVVTLRSLC